MDMEVYEIKQYKDNVKYGKFSARHGLNDMLTNIKRIHDEGFLEDTKFTKATELHAELMVKLYELGKIVNM